MPMLMPFVTSGLPDNKNHSLLRQYWGEKQGLENVIEAADRLRDEPLILPLSGRAAAKRGWKNGAAAWSAQHAIFPLQSYDALPALLKMGDCHLVVQKRGAADAVLPSKLTNILAVGGNAVITAEAHRTGAALRNLSGHCGLR